METLHYVAAPAPARALERVIAQTGTEDRILDIPLEDPYKSAAPELRVGGTPLD